MARRCQKPQGEVIDVLGVAGENDTEINAIMAEFGLPYRYPESVEKAADKIDAGITDEVVAQREDLRGVTTFTIDPATQKTSMMPCRSRNSIMATTR